MKKLSIFKFSVDVLSHALIAIGVVIFTFTYAPIIYSEIHYRTAAQTYSQPDIKVSETGEVVVDSEGIDSGLNDFEGIAMAEPVDSNFAIMIPKIEVNAPVVQDVSVANEVEYMAALREGVAHAVGTALPGEDGNMFLFAHSSLNFWQLGPYATVFNLLNKLEKGDLIIIVKDGVSYLYKVDHHEIIEGWNTDPFYTEYDGSVVTLITCYPPGTTTNRYLVVAKYVGKIGD